MYQNPYQQFNSYGYQQQYPQPQLQNNPIPTFNQNTLIGRFVDNKEQIGVRDVPMNGAYCIFPRNDMQEIYGKYWDGNGDLKTLTFKLADDGTEQIVTPTMQEQLKSFRDEIMERFDKLENHRKSRMEVSNNE